MTWTYSGCTNLTTAVCGPNVTNMSGAYQNCPNIHGDAYLYNVTNVRNCFYGRNTSNRLNIYTYKPTTFTSVTNAYSLVGADITWTEDTANSCWFNEAYNIYVYKLTNS